MFLQKEKKRVEVRRTAFAYNVAILTLNTEKENEKKTCEKARSVHVLTKSVGDYYGVPNSALIINQRVRERVLCGGKLKYGLNEKHFYGNEYNVQAKIYACIL